MSNPSEFGLGGAFGAFLLLMIWFFAEIAELEYNRRNNEPTQPFTECGWHLTTYNSRTDQVGSMKVDSLTMMSTTSAITWTDGRKSIIQGYELIPTHVPCEEKP
jgi:hypothetical protein